MRQSVQGLRTAVVALAGCLALAGCSRPPAPTPTQAAEPRRVVYELSDAEQGVLSQANFDKIEPLMTQEQVRAIFGTREPVVPDPQPGDVYELVWKHGTKEIAVRFRGDRSGSKRQVGVGPVAGGTTGRAPP